MHRIGAAVSGGPNPAEIVDLVPADSLGYESAWVAEGYGRDRFAILAACAMRTSRIVRATSISSVFVCTAPTIAMRASSVADLCNGRFILGLGSGHTAQHGPEDGVAYRKRPTRTRETVAIVRTLLRDGRVRSAGETIRIENFDLWYTPRHQEIPLYLSAVLPKGIAPWGEIADGIIVTRSTLNTTAPVRTQPTEAARRAGRDSGGIEITTLLPPAVDETRSAARAVLRPRPRLLCRVLSALQSTDGGARLCCRGRGDRRGMVTGRPPGNRACGRRCDDRCDQHRGHSGRLPRPARSVPAIRHRRADHPPVRAQP